MTDTGNGTICERHCWDCEGMDHHWMYVGEENEAGGSQAFYCQRAKP